MADDENEKTLYVGNLHKNVTEEILYELFLQAGPIENVNIPGLHNKNYNYGFVTYVHECSVDYAIKLYKGTCLFRNEILIKRRGEKNSNDQNVANSIKFCEKINNLDNIEDKSLGYGQSYLPQFHPTKESSNFGKTTIHNSNFMKNSPKGHWSDYIRPYNHDSRRNYLSRSVDSKEQYRNHVRNKSYRNRKGKY